jgi:hypothetical protein
MPSLVIAWWQQWHLLFTSLSAESRLASGQNQSYSMSYSESASLTWCQAASAKSQSHVVIEGQSVMVPDCHSQSHNYFRTGGLIPKVLLHAKFLEVYDQIFMFFATEPLRSQSLCNNPSDDMMGSSLMSRLGLCKSYVTYVQDVIDDSFFCTIYSSSSSVQALQSTPCEYYFFYATTAA